MFGGFNKMAWLGLSIKVWIYLLCFMILFFAGIAVLLFWYWKEIKNWSMLLWDKKNYLKVYFIYPNGQQEWQPLRLDNHTQFRFKGTVYDFDTDCVRFEKNTPVITYYFNVPNPINFKKRNEKNVDVVIDGKTYKEVMRAKIIRNLVTENRNMMILIIIAGVVALVLIIMMLHQLGLLDTLLASTNPVSKPQ